MAKPRYQVLCPWCGAVIERMAKADRIKEKRPPGSRIEKNVARCPECSKIILFKGPAPAWYWRQATLLAAGAIAAVVVIGLIIIVAFILRS